MEDVLRGLQAELAALNKRLQEVTKENSELRRELHALRVAGSAASQPAALAAATPADAGVVSGGEDDEDMGDQAGGARYRDAEASPGKPRKGQRRTVSEGAKPHGY